MLAVWATTSSALADEDAPPDPSHADEPTLEEAEIEPSAEEAATQPADEEKDAETPDVEGVEPWWRGKGIQDEQGPFEAGRLGAPCDPSAPGWAAPRNPSYHDVAANALVGAGMVALVVLGSGAFAIGAGTTIGGAVHLASDHDVAGGILLGIGAVGLVSGTAVVTLGALGGSRLERDDERADGRLQVMIGPTGAGIEIRF